MGAVRFVGDLCDVVVRLPRSLFVRGTNDLSLSDIDRDLLDECLARKRESWDKFVDRFMGLVVHVVNHTAQSRSIRLTSEDRDDLVGEVLLTVVKDDFAILRRFRGGSSLATYLTVIARRVVVRELLKRKSAARLVDNSASAVAEPAIEAEQRLDDREQVERLLDELDGSEKRVVRMYHLDGKSYEEISQAIGVPENSIGPTLTRARRKMRLFSAG
jgi:RNA polymerase sigma-70 factor (ECF subfamily)